MIGVVALHKGLLVSSVGSSGRMRILFDNGRESVETGLDPVGVRLVNVLGSSRDDMFWSLYDQIAGMSSLSESERIFIEETTLDYEANRRLSEIMNDVNAKDSIVESRKLPDSIEIYFF